MTIRSYLDSPELTGVAAIAEVGDDGRPFVRLDRTWFHPQGGGQRADLGTIAGRGVVHVGAVEGGEVRHYLEDASGLIEGAVVEVAVDPSARRRASRWHTAGHLIAAVLERDWPSLAAVAGHHWPGEGRVEFTPGDPALVGPIAEGLPAALALAIAQGWPVRVHLEPDGSRSVVVGDSRAVPCGGTHCPSVAELVEVRVDRVRAKGDRLRVSYAIYPDE